MKKKNNSIVLKSNIKLLYEKKIDYFHDLGLNTIDGLRNHYRNELISSRDLNVCIEDIHAIIKRLMQIKNDFNSQLVSSDDNVAMLQEINDTYFKILIPCWLI